MDLTLSLQPIGSFGMDPALDATAVYDSLIIGAGPAGLNAALYAARKGLKIGVVGMKKGGQVLDTSGIDNYLGLDGVSGEELAQRYLAHLQKYDVPIEGDAEVIGYRAEGGLHTITMSSGATYRGKTLIVATGTNSKKLDIPGENTYAGKGVAYCAICDAPLFIGKDVFVAGGGNSAAQAALDLAKQSRSVTLVQRSQLRADKVLVDGLERDPRITIHLKTRILEIVGEKAMTGIRVEDIDSGEQRVLSGEGIFIEIGHLPNTGAFASVLALDDTGQILVNDRMETSVPGIFAAGDVTNFPYKQIIIAVSGGAIAALSANDTIQRTAPTLSQEEES